MITEFTTNDPAQQRRGRVAIQRPRSDSFPSASAPAARSYLRSLRAAEMAAWEMTGGDCVLACYVDPACTGIYRAA